MQKNTQAKFDLAFEAIKELEKKAQWFINKNPHKINDVDFIKNTKNIEALSDFYNHMIQVIEDKEKALSEHQRYIKHLQSMFEHLLNCCILQDAQHAVSTMFYFQDFSPKAIKDLIQVKNKILKESWNEKPMNDDLFLAKSINTINHLYKNHENYEEN
jgi:hypothetical protein